MKKLYILLLGLSINSNAGIYCKNLSSCAEACSYYNQGYYRLDRDRDGIPCENLCSTPCNSHKAQIKRVSNTQTIHYSKKSRAKKVEYSTQKDYKKAFCKKMLGIINYPLTDGTIIDCYTSTYNFKVDFAQNAKSAVYKSLQYLDKNSNKTAVALIIKNKNDIKYAHSIKHIAKKHKIKIFTVDRNLKVKYIK